MQPRTPDEISAGIKKASVALKSPNPDLTIASDLLGVPQSDIERISGPAK